MFDQFIIWIICVVYLFVPLFDEGEIWVCWEGLRVSYYVWNYGILKWMKASYTSICWMGMRIVYIWNISWVCSFKFFSKTIICVVSLFFSRLFMLVIFYLHLCLETTSASIKWKWKLNLAKCKVSWYKIVWPIFNVDNLCCLFVCSIVWWGWNLSLLRGFVNIVLESKFYKLQYLLHCHCIVFYTLTFYGLMSIVCFFVHFDCFYGLVLVFESKTYHCDPLMSIFCCFVHFECFYGLVPIFELKT
jgi:hypothetical protein